MNKRALLLHPLLALPAILTLSAPALLPSGTFPELARLHGDSGARQLFAEPRFRVKELACPEAAIDIDTPADLENL